MKDSKNKFLNRFWFEGNPDDTLSRVISYALALLFLFIWIEVVININLFKKHLISSSMETSLVLLLFLTGTIFVAKSFTKKIIIDEPLKFFW